MATAVPLSEEEITQLAERLQEKFLQQNSGNSDLDPRDISRVRTDLYYVSKFIRHNRGKFDNAYNHMIECLKWRKSIGINDIRYDDIDESLWKSGMAWNEGFDVDGNNVVILNIHIHRKDSKKSAMLQKWIAFSFDMHTKVFPKNKMCMVFDATGAGLANMDMELIRFIVNCFKIYFPDILNWLLVYNMPWVLHAAWKIVQTWLSEGAINKVKFVTTETFQEYIPEDQLLVKFGGSNTWEFNYEAEKALMLSYMHKVFGDEGGGGDEASFEDPNDEPYYGTPGGDGSGATGQAGGKQVRFSSGLTPSRQSRFGTEDDGVELQTGSLDQRMLRKGSASGSGFRRRQVSRLMSLQEQPKGRSHDGEGVANGDITNRRYSEPVKGVTNIGDIMLSPSRELLFSGKEENDMLCTLTLTNISDNTVAYKIKTTAPLRYKVRPNLAIIDGKSVAKVHVMLSLDSSNTDVTQDKFLVQTYTLDPQAKVPDVNELSSFWKSLPMTAIKEHRMRCRLVRQDQSVRKIVSDTKGDGQPEASVSDAPTKPSGKSIKSQPTLEEKIERLMNTNADISKRLRRVLLMNYFIVLLLLSVIGMIYLKFYC